MLVGLVRAPSTLDPTKEAVERTDDRGRAGAGRWPTTAGAKRVAGLRARTTWSSPATSPRPRRTRQRPRRSCWPRQRSNRYRAPHFVYAVRREAARLLGDENLLDRGGLRIDTTLQYDGYQRAAEKWARVAYDLDRLSDEQLAARYGDAALGWIKQLQGRNINNDALVTLNYRTGAVIAYVGSANYYGAAPRPSTSRSSTWWARPIASRVRRSSPSPTPPASSAACSRRPP